MSIKGWYYLHKNGDLIYKRDLDGTDADIRESSFAVAIWPLDTNWREHAWRICVEGLAAGAKLSRVMELAEKWGCDASDAKHYASFLGGDIYRDGDKWCAVGPGFIDLAVSDAGFGDTPVEAFADLARHVGYRPSKVAWAATFKDFLEGRDPANSQFGVGG